MNNEFKKLSQGEVTRYILENGSSGGTSSGSVASVSMPMGGTRKRGDNLITQEADKKTVPASTPRNFVAKNAKTGGAGAHKDKKKAAKQGQEKHKKPFMEDHSTATGGWGQGSYDTYTAGNHGRGVAEDERDHPDHEIQMASSELLSIAKNAESLLDMVRRYSEQEGLDAWQQSKITKAADYLNSVLQSINGEQQGVAEGSTTRGGFGGSASQAQHEIQWLKNKIETLKPLLAKKPSVARQIKDLERQIRERELAISYQKEGVAEGVAETLPMPDAVKLLRQYGADHFKTTTNELHFYKNGRPFSVDLIFNNDATRSVSLSSLNSATRGLKGQGVAEGDAYMESLQQMVERQLEPNMELDTWIDNFQNADPNKYHQFKHKTPEKKK